MKRPREALYELVRTETALAVPPDVQVLADAIAQRGRAACILFYGSGLWKAAADDTVHDFYVLVDRFRDFDRSPLHAVLGSWMPPNVYYMEVPHEGGTLRCKFALMRVRQFARAARGQAVTPQIWARFAQPCRIIYARDETVRRTVLAAIVDAIVTFHRNAWQLVSRDAPPRDVWLVGLRDTYASELRSEQPERTAVLYSAVRDSLEQRTELMRSIDMGRSAGNRLPSLIKHPFLKCIAFVRLLKATLTFDGAVDYALWKVERQSGVKLQATDRQRRYPLIFGWPLVWTVFRKGGLR